MRANSDLTHRSFPRRLDRRRLIISVAAAATALGLLWTALGLLWKERGAILAAAGRTWAVSDRLAPADAVAVLGGGVDIRPAAAARLYMAGMVKQILVSNGGTGSDQRGSPDREALVRLGIPAAAISEFAQDPASTYNEAHALARWARQNRARRIIVPTEIFPSRRVHWIMRRELSHVGTHVMVEALSPGSYDLNDWWRNPQGIDNFTSEIIKYVYYRLAYWRS
jgi:uncharacterized SAM-binding protein YcdF (DUF218 family)